VPLYKQALEMLAQSPGMPQIAHVRINLFWVYHRNGQHDAAMSITEEGILGGQRHDKTGFDVAIFTSLRAAAWIAQGEPQRALGALQETLATFKRLQQEGWHLTAQTFLADAQWAMGESESAEALYRSLLAPLEQQGDIGRLLHTLAALARLTDARGASTESEALRQRHAQIVSSVGFYLVESERL
jgi:tetratricopeptide (TPR) repeat protein